MSYRTDNGKLLIAMIRNNTIQKNVPSDYPNYRFNGDYEYGQFRLYLGGVSRYLLNRQLEELPYFG